MTITSVQPAGPDKELMELMQTCKNKVGANGADLTAIMQKKIPESHSGKCLVECLFSAGNFMKDGKLNKQGVVAAATPSMKGDSEKIKKLKAMMDECAKEVNVADPCETAKNIVVCCTSKGKSFGFSFPRPSPKH